MKAEYIDNRADDDSVVNAARVSFSKKAENYTPDKNADLIRYLAKHNHWTPFAHQRFTFKTAMGDPLIDWPCDPLLITGLVQSDGLSKVRHSFYGWVQLLKSGCVKKSHMADLSSNLRKEMPNSFKAFNMVDYGGGDGSCFIANDTETDPLFIDVTIRMSAPVPIRTQCFKHKAGFTENEESRRYIASRPEVFIPDEWRMAADNVKQGSSGVHEYNSHWYDEYVYETSRMIDTYEGMIEDGVCPEQARFILPQGCIVNWVWTGNLASYARFYNQRTDPHAQKEVRDLAEMVGNIIEPLYPVSWKALT